ncbi:MAG TPA: protein kinase [Polyangiales bacterium]|nr:protein kinase [Polyangiales bacterium]
MTLSSSESESAADAEVTTETDRTSSVTSRRLARILEDGLQFGKYRVIRLIAIGGMSEIYEAEHIALDKRVALKVMRRDLAENATARQRFITEGVNAARLRHTNVVDVTDVGEVDELPFLVMALLDGEDLGRIYDRQGRIPIEEIVDLLLPVASAVALGHDKGVVHRDLKPDNIFLHREGCRMIPKVLDFGVSRVMTARRITLNSSVFGTPHYMAPEQARGGPTDARTDQYSLGVILYEGVTGRLPRDSSNPIELLHAVAYDSFRPPSEYSEIPPGLEAVILRAMASDPVERFESMRELAIALLPFASDAAREYWSLELASTIVVDTSARLPQTARHPSPTPATLARLTRPSMRMTTPSRHGEIVVARATISRALPPPPPPPRSRTITPLRIMAHARAMNEFEAALALHRKRRARSLLTGAATGLLLGASIFGFWFWRQGPNAPVVTAGTRSRDSNEFFDVSVEAAPAHATIVVDGSTVATGLFDRRFKRDGVEHELRVSAPGWTVETVKFRDAPPPKTIRLERAVEEQVAAATPNPQAPVAQPSGAKVWRGSRRVPGAVPPSAASADGQSHQRVAPSEAVQPKSDATGATPRVAIAGDSTNGSPHVAVVDPGRPRVRIVDEYEPKVRVVE